MEALMKQQHGLAWIAVVVGALASGCSRGNADAPDFVEGDPAAPQPAAPADSQPSDVAAPAAEPTVADPPVTTPMPTTARCDKTKPFGRPTLVDGINTASSDGSARLSFDEKTLYLTRWNPTSKILEADRPSTDAKWVEAPILAALTSKSIDGAATVTADELTMFLHSDRPGTAGSLDIWLSKRTAVTAEWGVPTRVAAVNGTARDSDPYVRPDGKMLVFTSTRGTRGDANLYAAYVDETQTASAPRALTELNTSADEDNPVLAADGLAIYFARRGPGSQDIFVARRQTLTEKFGTPTRIDELATPTDERPTWISADECVLYFSMAGAPGGYATTDVYVAERPQ
jgi:hypothetical protein